MLCRLLASSYSSWWHTPSTCVHLLQAKSLYLPASARRPPPEPQDWKASSLSQGLWHTQGQLTHTVLGTVTLSTPLPELSMHMLLFKGCWPPPAWTAAPTNYTWELHSKPALPWASPQHRVQGCLEAITGLIWDNASQSPLAQSTPRTCWKMLDLARSSHILL